MREKLHFYMSLALIAAAFVLLLCLPQAAAEGARRGLAVCAQSVVPSLLPFLVLSSLASETGLSAALSGLLATPLRRLGIPSAAAAPFVLGLLGGYPVGALTLAELVRSGELTPEEGGRLLPWCNNTGPGFIVGVAGCAVFSSAKAGLLLYFCHILSALTLALFSRRGAFPNARQPTPQRRRGLSEALPVCVTGAAAKLLGICAFVVFFSVVTALLAGAGALGRLCSLLSRCFGAEEAYSAALLCGLLELGNGVTALRGLAPTSANLMLAAFLLGFGGLSVHCQTRAALHGTDVKCARHFVGRIAHGLLSAGFVWLFFVFVRRRQI